MKYKKYNGFTLVELLVVISIISIIAAITLNALSKAKSKARDAQRISDMTQVRNALELFYATYGKYPETAGAATWDGQWQNLSTCLETGSGCWAGVGDNSSISGYVPVIKKVPQDPLDDPNTLSDSDPTYYYGYPSACGTGNAYRLAVYLENGNQVLNTDLDGSFYNNNSGCEDANKGYCLGVGSCSGW